MNAITKEQLIEDLKASTQNSSGMFEIGEDTICNLMSMLTAHPAPVAPDEMTPQQASRSYGGEVRGYRDGWNACRAAMLQGKSEQPQNAQQNIPENIPGGNSPGIPDGWISCSERMPNDKQYVCVGVNLTAGRSTIPSKGITIGRETNGGRLLTMGKNRHRK